MSALGIGLAIGTAALALRRPRRRRRARASLAIGGLTRSRTIALRRELEAQLRGIRALTLVQRRMLVLIAYGESRFNPATFNGDAVERNAAEAAFERLASNFASCGGTKASYGTGSGGRFGRLVPYYANDLWHVQPCIAPATIHDGRHDLVSAVVCAHAIGGHPNFAGTVLSMRAGWATLEWLQDPPAEKREKWARHAEELGYGASFLDAELPRFPGHAPTLLDALRRGRGLLTGPGGRRKRVNFAGVATDARGRLRVNVKPASAEGFWVPAAMGGPLGHAQPEPGASHYSFRITRMRAWEVG